MKAISSRNLRWPARVFGLLAALLVISAEEGGGGTSHLDRIGKIVAWSAMCFLPLFGLNLDLFAHKSAQIAGAGAVCVHVVLMTLVYQHLDQMNFITIAPLAIVEMFLLYIPLWRVRTAIGPVS